MIMLCVSRHFGRAAVVLAVLALSGCASMTPGDLDRVRPDSDRPYAGNVYLLRGFIGIWSYGIDHLGQRINEAGIRASVYQQDQSQRLCEAIIERYSKATDPEPLVLIGHSYGADDALRIAKQLEEHNIKVDLVITLDPVTPPKVPANIGLCYNIYQPNLLDDLPFFRGIPLEPEKPEVKNLQNVNIRAERRDLLLPDTDHFNIEKNTLIHAEVVSKIKQVCPPREKWVQMRQAARTGTAMRASPSNDPAAAGSAVPPAAAGRPVGSALPTGQMAPPVP